MMLRLADSSEAARAHTRMMMLLFLGGLDPFWRCRCWCSATAKSGQLGFRLKPEVHLQVSGPARFIPKKIGS